MTRDYYEMLGVQRASSMEDIRKAYKKCAMKLHPDRNPEGAEVFKVITHAYQTLASPNQKRKYDADLAAKDARRRPFARPAAGFGAAAAHQAAAGHGTGGFQWPPRPGAAAGAGPRPANGPSSKPDSSWFNQFPQPKFCSYSDELKKGGMPPPPQPPRPQGDPDGAFARRQHHRADATPAEEELRRRRREEEERQRKQQQEFAKRDVNFAQWYKEKCKETDESEIRARVRKEMERRRQQEDEELQKRQRQEEEARAAERRKEDERLAQRRADEAARRRMEDARRRSEEAEQIYRARDAETARQRQVREVEEAMNELQRRRKELEKEREERQREAPHLSDDQRVRMKVMREHRAVEAERLAEKAEARLRQLQQRQQEDRVQRDLARRRREEDEKREEEEHSARLQHIREREEQRRRDMNVHMQGRKEAAAAAARESAAFREKMLEGKRQHELELAKMREESDRIEQEMRAKLEAVRAAKREGRPIPTDLRLSPLAGRRTPPPVTMPASPPAVDSPLARGLDDAIIAEDGAIWVSPAPASRRAPPVPAPLEP
eukprot:TRINITY_DN200_c0_g1_i3.p1 TRINITY_DN200_c0_g1~~TRINITY_DN200_c0_g1_i3.p1  ORF type:complete len:592 (+),score=211.99 TRINITY_DN200_c0_g1_i3:128-1777(+)